MLTRLLLLLLLASQAGPVTAATTTAVTTGATANCRPPRVALPESQRKFHPGHYVAIGRAELRKGVSTALGEGVEGIQLRYRWADLEPKKGQYDFSAISRDLDIVAQAGLQFVVLLEDKTFRDEWPTPAYLHEEYTLRGKRGYTAKRWDPYVIERLERLVTRLGTQFDCHPNFEGIGLQETALGVAPEELAANGYTPEKYRDALVRVLRSAASSVPRSRVFWYMNFLPGNQAYIGDIANAVVGRGVVMGGPDVLPENQALVRRVYPYYQQFNGRLKLFGSMQHDSYQHPRSDRAAAASSALWSMEELYEFARDDLHVDYIFWEYRSSPKPGKQSFAWNDARAVIARHPRIREGARPVDL